MVDDGKSFWQGTSQWRFVLSHDGAVSRPGTTGWTEKIEVWSYAQPGYPMFIRSFIHSLNWNSPATNLSVSTSWLSIHTQHPPQALCFKNLQDMFEKQWTSAQFLCTWWRCPWRMHCNKSIRGSPGLKRMVPRSVMLCHIHRVSQGFLCGKCELFFGAV